MYAIDRANRAGGGRRELMENRPNNSYLLQPPIYICSVTNGRVLLEAHWRQMTIAIGSPSLDFYCFSFLIVFVVPLIYVRGKLLAARLKFFGYSGQLDIFLYVCIN